MKIIMDKEATKTDVEALAIFVEALYNLLFDNTKNQIACCYDDLLGGMLERIRELRKKIYIAPHVQ